MILMSMYKLISHVCHLLIRNIESIQMLNQRLAFLRMRYAARLNPVLKSFVSISQQYPTTTHIPIESFKTCATTLCLGVTINTTSSYGNIALWHFSAHSVRYDLASAILCHHQSTFKRSINVVDLEWLCLHLFYFCHWMILMSMYKLISHVCHLLPCFFALAQ